MGTSVESHDNNAGTHETARSHKVLLVDDEEEYVTTLSERLKLRDFDTDVVYCGEEALTYVHDHEPAVMVLDLRMPGIDGTEVLAQVKQRHPNVEVIILTGHGSEKDEQMARQLGAFAYLQKPVSIDLLTKTIREAFDRIDSPLSQEGEMRPDRGSAGQGS